jgi:plastocyanin
MRILISLAAALALFGCGSSSSSGVTDPQPVATTSVSLQNLAFRPGAIRVASGATVQFTNNDGITHNVTFSSAAITGATDFATGTRSVLMPAAPGTYAYHCTIHAGMAGSVVVQ